LETVFQLNSPIYKVRTASKAIIIIAPVITINMKSCPLMNTYTIHTEHSWNQ